MGPVWLAGPSPYKNLIFNTSPALPAHPSSFHGPCRKNSYSHSTIMKNLVHTFGPRHSTILCSLFIFTLSVYGMEPTETFTIWPAVPPGQSSARGEEKRVEGRPRPFYQITDVSKPTVSVFLPPRERRLGTGLLILP